MTRLEQLRQTIEVLASTSEEQIRFLAQFFNREALNDGWNADEIGLQFEDAVYLVNGLLNAGEIGADTEACVSDLDEKLKSLSGKKFAEFWTVKGIKQDARWDDIRDHAMRCLETMGMRNEDNGHK